MSSAPATPAASTPPPLPDPSRVVQVPPSSPAVIAHRGGAGYAPENTLAAFENGARLDADALEMDVVLAADGQQVVVHDDVLSRTTNCTFTVSANASTSVANCDAAWWWRPGVAYTQAGATITPLRGTGVNVPTLRSVLAWNASRAGGPRTLSIEVKLPGAKDDRAAAAAAGALLQEVQSAGLREKVVVQSFYRNVLDYVKATDPTVRTALIVGSGGTTSCLVGVQYAAWRNHDFVYVNYGTADLDANCVAYAHEYGRKITVWPVDRPSEVARARSLGVDEVLTSFPACVYDVLGRTYPRPIYTPLLSQTTGLITCAVGG